MYNYIDISTNNLKNISVCFNDNELIYIGGISGSGKSSLAFDTIAAISENEYGSLIHDNKAAVNYRIREYGTVLVAATLRQLNFNVNPRSIVLTYFGLYPYLASILGQCTNMSTDSFSLNGPYRCRSCNGIGYANVVDELMIIDAEKSLKEGPFKCWNSSYSDFFSKLLHNFCEEKKIDESKKFGELDAETQRILLRSKGETKYKISYTASGRKRTKTSVYIGPIVGMESEMKDMFGVNLEKYSKPCICPICHGSRLTEQVNRQRVIGDIDVEFMLTQSMSEVGTILREIRRVNTSDSIGHACDCLMRFIDVCKRLNISHLNFSRAIGTLSGGELQRIRMAQLLLGKLKNLLIVLDEPTGSLNKEEAESIIAVISELKKSNTVIVVDHNDQLRKIADRAYFLGPGSGVNGGQIIKESDYLKMQEKTLEPLTKKSSDKISVILKSDYVDYGNGLDIYVTSLNGISGPSGIGKSTILRDILPYQLENYKYITQKPIKANRNSTVASYTGLQDEIKKYYTIKTKKDKKIFSMTQKGACSKCSGKGSVLLGSFYEEQLFVECEECGGTGYADNTLECCVDGLNIYEFLSQNCEEIINKGISVSKKFDSTVQLLDKLGLGHLALNQRVSTLSGGENQRIKLLQTLRDGRTKVYGLDEPSRGLGRKEMLNLISIIYDNIEKKGKTFIVAEHNVEFLALCPYVSELRKENGKVVIESK